MSNPPNLVPRKALERFRLTPPTPPPPPTPVMTHKQFEHGSFTLHSGLVCFTHEETRLVVHVHKTTGEVSLPRGPCRVLPLLGRFGGNIGMESFNAAAVRMARQELGYQTIARGYIVRALLQPEDVDDAEPVWLMPPFVIDCGSEPVKAIAKVTAWFLAFMVGDYVEDEDRPQKCENGELEEGELEEGELEEGELWEGELEGGELGGGEGDREDTRVRGPEWVVKYMTLARAAQHLPEHEAEIIQKAIAFVKVHFEV
ncbi:hypothetical protein MMC17_001613 [Xylographa soralifera]|nr:hypothetical protein [Xylographa soralifera]